jgi:hypothetical protein
MIHPNVLNAVGEAFEAHHITPRPDEQMADTVARALRISEGDARRWLEALDEGCAVEEANRRVGIVSHKEIAPLLNTLARLIGKALGAISSESRGA